MRLVELHKAGNHIEAESLRAALLDAGLECHLGGEHFGSMPGISANWNAGAVSVVVKDADAPRARQIKDEWLASLPPRPPRKPYVFQFSLKTLFILVTLNALFCAALMAIGERWRPMFGMVCVFLLTANLTAIAFIRKQRRQLPDE